MTLRIQQADALEAQHTHSWVRHASPFLQPQLTGAWLVVRCECGHKTEMEILEVAPLWNILGLDKAVKLLREEDGAGTHVS